MVADAGVGRAGRADRDRGIRVVPAGGRRPGDGGAGENWDEVVATLTAEGSATGAAVRHPRLDRGHAGAERRRLRHRDRAGLESVTLFDGSRHHIGTGVRPAAAVPQLDAGGRTRGDHRRDDAPAPGAGRGEVPGAGPHPGRRARVERPGRGVREAVMGCAGPRAWCSTGRSRHPQSAPSSPIHPGPEALSRTDRAIRDRWGRTSPTPLPVPDEPESSARVKLSAAWLIERAGFGKGFAGPGGRVAISGKHTLALTNGAARRRSAGPGRAGSGRRAGGLRGALDWSRTHADRGDPAGLTGGRPLFRSGPPTDHDPAHRASGDRVGLWTTGRRKGRQ